MSLLVIFVLSLISQILSTIVRSGKGSDATGAAQPLTGANATDSDDSSASILRPRRMLEQRRWYLLLREMAKHALSIALNLAVMLLAMTFNVGIFVAVVLGLALGAVLDEGPRHASERGAERCHG